VTSWKPFALLISGVVRVYKLGETGREITPLPLRPGRILHPDRQRHPQPPVVPAIASVEEDAEAVMIRQRASGLGASSTMPGGISSSSCSRSALASVIGPGGPTVAFRRMDVRIAGFLLRRSR